MEMSLGALRRAEESEFASGLDGDPVKLRDEVVENSGDAKRGRGQKN